jgi:Raf kinase inhibitor-like YbhB/YbcL family protein
MKLTSSAFADETKITAKYTTVGADVSPPLAWTGAPTGTKSLALICDDPDAPSPRKPGPEPWVHWVIFNIPGDATALPEGVERKPEPKQIAGARQGKNSWTSDNIGYRGPAPPPGSGPHRYFFRLYALDKQLELTPGASKAELLKAMAGHVLAEAQTFGTYER